MCDHAAPPGYRDDEALLRDDEMTKLFEDLRAHGVPDTVLLRLQTAFHECCLYTLGALRQFSDDLLQLVESIFDANPVGKLKAKGLVASIRDIAIIPAGGVGVPIDGGGGKKRHKSSTGGSSSSVTSSSQKGSSKSGSTQVLPGVKTVSPNGLTLPAHLRQEALRLRKKAAEDNPLTEPMVRPLIVSTAVWLARMGVVCKTDHPGVIDRVGELLHSEELLPMKYLAVSKGSRHPTSFSDRINYFLINHPRRRNAEGNRSFVIEVCHDEELDTPLRALRSHGYLTIMDEGVEPAQGHSGKSIIGMGRPKRSESPPPNPFRNFDEAAREPVQRDSAPNHSVETPDTNDAVPATGQTTSAPAHAARATTTPTATTLPQPSISLPPDPRGPYSMHGAAGMPTVLNQLDAASMLSSLARCAGLDISVSNPGRNSGSAKFKPTPEFFGQAQSTSKLRLCLTNDDYSSRHQP